MRPWHTAPAEAHSPDADRAGPDAPAYLPDWLVHLLALLIHFLQQRRLAAGHRGSPALTSWVHDRPDLPPGSAQALAASVRGTFGRAIEWMCRRCGIGPRHPDWPELSRAIVAFGGSVQGFRAGLPPCGLQWWENPAIVPGMIGMAAVTPAADAMAASLSRNNDFAVPPPALNVAPDEPEPAVAPAPRRPAVAPVATGPPNGPPACCHHHSCCAYPTGARAWPAPPF